MQASDNIQPVANTTMSGSDGTLLPASVAGLTREATETTDEDQHASTIEATDGTMPVPSAAPEQTTEAGPTTEATDCTMPVKTAAMETTGETT